MKPKRRLGHDANVIAWNVAEQHSACRLARTHDSHACALCRQSCPPLVVGGDAAAMIIADIDCFSPRHTL